MYPIMRPFDLILPDEPVALDLTHLFARLHLLALLALIRGVMRKVSCRYRGVELSAPRSEAVPLLRVS